MSPADLTRQMNKNWELKVGGRMDLWTMRLFSIGSISNYMTLSVRFERRNASARSPVQPNVVFCSPSVAA